MTNNKEHNENLNDPIFFEGNNKRNIYNVPKNYFESLQDAIEEKLIGEELSELSISKRNIYEMPDNYFNSINGSQQSKNAKIISINKWYKSNLAKIAASVTVILTIGYLSFLLINSLSNDNDLISNNKDYDFEITEYETGLFDEVEDELMASLIFEEEISYVYTISFNENNQSNDELEDYLDSEIDLSIEF